jgi:hypothetical protein
MRMAELHSGHRTAAHFLGTLPPGRIQANLEISRGVNVAQSAELAVSPLANLRIHVQHLTSRRLAVGDTAGWLPALPPPTHALLNLGAPPLE